MCVWGGLYCEISRVQGVNHMENAYQSGLVFRVQICGLGYPCTVPNLSETTHVADPIPAVL